MAFELSSGPNQIDEIISQYQQESPSHQRQEIWRIEEDIQMAKEASQRAENVCIKIKELRELETVRGVAQEANENLDEN